MSYSTWHFITPSFSLGWLFRNMVLPRFVSMWQEMFEKTDVWFDCLEIIQWILSQDGCFINTVERILLHHSYRLHIRQLSRPRTSRWRFSTTLTTLYCRPVTAALELVTQSLIILPRSRVSVLRFYVRRALTAASSSVCRRADDLFRQAAAAPSALPFFFRGPATLHQFDTDQHERHSSTE